MAASPAASYGLDLALPGVGFVAAACLKVSREAQVPPLPVGFDPRAVIALRQMNGIAAEQPPQRRFEETWMI